MLRMLLLLLALAGGPAAHAQAPAPTPVTVPDDVEIEAKLRQLPDGSLKVDWRFVNFTFPSPTPGPGSNPNLFPLPDHGTLDVSSLPPGTAFHTWATQLRVQNWVRLGGPTADELDYLVRTGNGMAGGGFYTSLDSLDSASFGEVVAIFRTDVALRMVDTSSLNRFGFNGGDHLLNRFNLKLRDLGMDGAFYNAGTQGPALPHLKYGTWINFYTNRGLKNAHAGTMQEVLDHVVNPKASFDNLLDLDEKFALEPDELVRTRLPLAWKILRGEKLTDAEWQEWFPPASQDPDAVDDSFSSFLYKAAMLFPGKNLMSPPAVDHQRFLRALIRTESDRLRSAAIQALGSDKPEYHQLTPPRDPNSGWTGISDNTYSVLTQLGFQDVLFVRSPFQMPCKLFPDANGMYWGGNQGSANAFLNSLQLSLNFIDFPDLVVAAAEGNPRPWALYDQPGRKPLLDRYQEIQRLPFGGGSPKKFTELMLKIHAILSGVNEGYRENEILAGGSLHPDHQGGFYRVSEIEKKRLLDNPFLSVEIKDDPDQKPPVRSYLARHRYPSAATFERYTAYFTPELKSELERARASGALDDRESPEFKRLNRKMIGEMVDWAMETYFGDFHRLYLNLISIHPFPDFNGRTLRALNARFGIYIALTDWDQDLFLSPPEFEFAVEVGRRKYALLVDALEAELAKNPSFPRFYDLPEWWMVQQNIEERPENPGPWVAKKKRIWSDPKVKARVKQKRFKELPQSCNGILRGIENENAS